jgi:FdhD protein
MSEDSEIVLDSSCVRVPITRLEGGASTTADDVLAVEEPLAIRLISEQLGKRRGKTVSVTMRTPGHDRELAVGFLLGEGLIHSIADIANVDHCEATESDEGYRNTVCVGLKPEVEIDFERLNRNFYMTSSCGVCGKASLDAIEVQGVRPLPSNGPRVSATVLYRLPELLRAAQPVFQRTGGLHASALFDLEGRLLRLREDVGRHNALDKLIGASLLAGEQESLCERIVLLSGRASFELIQKAVLARVPIVVAIGAPSSLAVQLAERYGLTLAGFLRGDRCNVYAGADRLTSSGART